MVLLWGRTLPGGSRLSPIVFLISENKDLGKGQLYSWYLSITIPKSQHIESTTVPGKASGQLRPYRSLWQREKSNHRAKEVEFNVVKQELKNQRRVVLRRKLVGGYSRLPRIPVCSFGG